MNDEQGKYEHRVIQKRRVIIMGIASRNRGVKEKITIYSRNPDINLQAEPGFTAFAFVVSR